MVLLPKIPATPTTPATSLRSRRKHPLPLRQDAGGGTHRTLTGALEAERNMSAILLCLTFKRKHNIFICISHLSFGELLLVSALLSCWDNRCLKSFNGIKVLIERSDELFAT